MTLDYGIEKVMSSKDETIDPVISSKSFFLKKNVWRALPAISFLGGPGVSPGPSQAWAPG
jgi:hypothetical protein